MISPDCAADYLSLCSERKKSYNRKVPFLFLLSSSYVYGLVHLVFFCPKVYLLYPTRGTRIIKLKKKLSKKKKKHLLVLFFNPLCMYEMPRLEAKCFESA